MLVTRRFIFYRHSSSSDSYLLRCQSQVLLSVVLNNLKRILIKEGISKIILDSLERMPFDNQLSHFSIFINVLHYMMKSGWDDGAVVNPRMPSSKLYEVSASIT